MKFLLEGMFVGCEESEYLDKQSGNVEKNYQMGIMQGLEIAKFRVDEEDYLAVYQTLAPMTKCRAMVTPRAYLGYTGSAALSLKLDSFELVDDASSGSGKSGSKKSDAAAS